MKGKLFKLLAIPFIAITLANNVQFQADQEEVSILIHLAAFIDENFGAHEQEHDDHHGESSGRTSHKHRHSPSDPEHTHDQVIGGVGLVLDIPTANATNLKNVDVALNLLFPLTETPNIVEILSSVFRPPIIS
ncbi:MAG: hypothetical protein SGJ18_02860 [Pseudomonadota bacterium]|nr:hypothetical protein [Pseudomonadota bacterium]